jgi:DNA repair protein RecN (Recombination protein N)
VLRRLRIENLVLIREAELELAPGLNAITGETGAGKTILAQALGLLLGAKGDDSYVGAAGEEAYVEAELDLPEDLEALDELRPEDEDALVAARRVFADGRTRAYAWGRAAAREDVSAAVERVVAMSGQFEQRRLARPSYQLEVLDRFCGDEQLARRAAARAAWRNLQAAQRRHDELTANAAFAEAQVAEMRALVEDTDGMDAGDEEKLRTAMLPSSPRVRRRLPQRSPRMKATEQAASSASRSAPSRHSSGSRPSWSAPAASSGT